MAQTDIDICNLAINRCGGEPIDALDEETPLGAFCLGNYAQKRDWLLGKHRWVFAAATEQLARRVTTPVECPRAYAFDPPVDVVGEIAAYRTAARGGGPGCDVTPVNGYIACDSATLFVEYTRRIGEDRWPVWFAELVITAFAADIARGPGQNRALANDFEMRAFGPDGQGGLLLAAKTEDGRNAPQRTLGGWDDGALVAARFGGGFESGLVHQAERYGLTFIDFPYPSGG